MCDCRAADRPSSVCCAPSVARRRVRLIAACLRLRLRCSTRRAEPIAALRCAATCRAALRCAALRVARSCQRRPPPPPTPRSALTSAFLRAALRLRIETQCARSRASLLYEYRFSPRASRRVIIEWDASFAITFEFRQLGAFAGLQISAKRGADRSHNNLIAAVWRICR